ncbi:MAG: GerW family sporulation protein [Oscillospiraceae bacterium]|nr:GerW family sporulation protein [Oscillospiraceae bacterium]
MDKHPINDLMGETMEKIREMVDTEVVVGKPITTPDGVTLVPLSKVSFGFVSGGSDFASKKQAENRDKSFGGGSGAGVKITPVAFLVLKGESVKIVPVFNPSSNTLDRLVDMIPDLFEKVTGYIDKKTDKEF